MTERYQSISSQRLLKHRKKRRAEKTSLDYLVTALSPLLIMLLVGSLVLFLIQVFYRGEMAGGIRWVMSWFVLAIVLVARIGIEQSSAHAAMYGAALAAATWVFLMMTHPAFLFGIVLLALVWWSSHKLVNDCTLIDDEDDSSDQGLLEKNTHPPIHEPRKSNHLKSTHQATNEPKTKHSPGRWLLYYSLAALPLFGIGQLFLDHSIDGESQSGFQFLTLYLIAAAGLLLSTSFLGLRRYLRQRSLKMPGGIATKWLLSGAKVAAIVFLIAWLFPRPGVTSAWSGLAIGIEHSIQQASQLAMRFNPSGTGKGAEKGSDSPGGEQQAKSLDNTGKTDSSNQESSKDSPQKTGTQVSKTNKEEQTSTRSEASSSSAASFAKILLVVIILALIYRNRASILALLKGIWTALIAFFQGIGSPRRAEKHSTKPSVEKPTIKKSFNSFKNPFNQRNSRNWPHEALVAYTYEALESWAEKEGTPAASDQTPLERVRQISSKHPALGLAAINLGEHYTLLAYRKRLSKNFDVEMLKQLWREMR